MKQHFTLWFYRNFVNISFPKLNLISLWGMLGFTVVFTWLTIHEEHKVFERNFYQDARAYAINHGEALKTEAHRIETLLIHELGRPEGGDPVRIVAAFSQADALFVNLYSPSGKALYTDMSLEAMPGVDALHEQEVRYRGIRQFVLLTQRELPGGYRLITAVPTESSEALKAAQTTELKRRVTRIVLEFVTLAFIIFGFMLGINTIYNGLLKRDVRSFMDFFQTAAKKDAVMNPKMIFFAEFKKMVEYANEMVTQLASHKRSLESVNQQLEDKVRDKTAALEVKNFALEEEKAFSQQLLQIQKEFLRHAIHETNTPLSVIVANIDLFTMKHGKNSYLSKIDASVKNIFNIFDDLAYLVKKDQIDYPKKPIDLCEFVRARLDFFAEVAEQAGVRFVFGGCHGGARIYFNETKLQRIIDNNLTNAIKYTLKHEPISVEVRTEGASLAFRIASRSQMIEDTGKVFDAFYREGHTVEGFGLGLNLVKSICDEENVTISLHSDEQETWFCYTFVRDDENTAA